MIYARPIAAAAVFAQSILARAVSIASGSFSPLSLAPTVWYDPSDLTTLFQDSYGTTKVTASGQPVGLMLDKSQGLVLGPERLTTTTFESGLGAWQRHAGAADAVDILNGSMRVRDIGGMNGMARHSYTTTANVWHEATLTVSSPAGAHLLLYAGDQGSGSNNLYTTLGGIGQVFNNTTFKVRWFQTTASASVTIMSAMADTSIFVSSISVKELPGNHASQPTAGKRPILGRNPFTGRRNLLTYTEDFSNAAWEKTGATITVNATAAPDGTATADKLVENSSVSEHRVYISVVTDGNVAGSIYVKRGERSKVGFGSQGGLAINAKFDLVTGTFITNPSGEVTATALQNGWYRLSVRNLSGTHVGPYIYLLDDSAASSYAGDGASGVYIWGAQLELGSTPTAYQKVVSAYDVTEAGVNDCWYLQGDGVDDFLQTGNINLTGTDKLSVFAGVRKVDDAARIVMELSTSISYPGTFFLVTGADGGGTGYSSLAHGGGLSGLAISFQTATAFTYSGADLAVLSIQHDIAGDLSTMRRNGVVGTPGTADKGTGNFGNYALYLFSRAGTISFFNGRLYPLIIVPRLTTTEETAATEKWIASKTGVTLPTFTGRYTYSTPTTASAPATGNIVHGDNILTQLQVHKTDLDGKTLDVASMVTGNTLVLNGFTYTLSANAVDQGAYVTLYISPTTQRTDGTYSVGFYK